jgi:hypothetical protein
MICNQWFACMLRRMMTGIEIRSIIRSPYQKNLSPEEREETRNPPCASMAGLLFQLVLPDGAHQEMAIISCETMSLRRH